jgi:hypothetical protein
VYLYKVGTANKLTEPGWQNPVNAPVLSVSQELIRDAKKTGSSSEELEFKSLPWRIIFIKEIELLLDFSLLNLP